MNDVSPATPCPVCAARPSATTQSSAPAGDPCAPADAVRLLEIPLEPIPTEEPEPAPRPENHFATESLPVRRAQSGSVVGDFLRFRVMVLPIVIQVTFWMSSLVVVGQGLMIVAASFDPMREPFAIWDASRTEREPQGERATRPPAPARAGSFSPPLLALGLAVSLLGPLLLRMACEFLIVVFRIHDELKAANDRNQYRSA